MTDPMPSSAHGVTGEDGEAGSSPWLERIDRQQLWHAFSPTLDYPPFIIERAEGFELIDIHGNRYLDAESSLWCSVHGHRQPQIDQAIREQLDRVAHVTLLGMSCDTTVRLTHRLVASAPGLDHVFYSSDGACAVEVAMKLSFEYWHRLDPQTTKRKFLCFDSAYHGDTLGTLSVGGIDRFNRVFSPLFFDVVRGPLLDGYRMPVEATGCEPLQWYSQQAERLIAQHHHSLAAVVIEPLVQCAAGIVTHPSGLLREIERLCRKYDVLLIADEIAVGCGRTGTWLACQQEQVQPDLLCLGKGLSAGYLPLAATLISNKIWRQFLGTADNPGVFCHGHTFGGNPLACAAALASLDLIERHQTLANVAARAEQLKSRLAELSDHPHVGDLRGSGLAMGLELVRNRDSKERFDPALRVGKRICEQATRQGVWLRPLQDVIVLMPPLAIDEASIDRIADVLIQVVRSELERVA